MQAQADANAKAQQAAADAEIQKNQAKAQADMQLETLKADTKLNHLREEVRLKKELMTYEFELNQQVRQQSRSENMNLEAMKEGGKDRREAMKQQNAKKPPKKFESSGNDILGGGMGLDKFNPQIGN